MRSTRFRADEVASPRRRRMARVGTIVIATVVLLVAAVASAQPATPQSNQEPTLLSSTSGFGTPAEVLDTAPIFLLPDATRLPLRIARPGSRVRVLQQTGDWANVQFEDPQYGRRTGYIQNRFIRVEPPPTDGVPAPLPASQAQDSSANRSESAGFFVGGGFEANAIIPNDNQLFSDTETGRGVGLVVGYGFSRRWSLYGALSVASMQTADLTGTYSLTHVGVGTRVHFLSPARRAVPFLQAGISGRAINHKYVWDLIAFDVTASGPGGEFGGGANVHFTPAFALSAAATWMVGNFTTYEVNSRKVGSPSIGATSARVHVGAIWFPRGRRSTP